MAWGKRLAWKCTHPGLNRQNGLGQMLHADVQHGHSQTLSLRDPNATLPNNRAAALLPTLLPAQGAPVAVYTLHPGAIPTDLQRDMDSCSQVIFKKVTRPLLKSIPQGAATQVCGVGWGVLRLVACACVTVRQIRGSLGRSEAAWADKRQQPAHLHVKLVIIHAALQGACTMCSPAMHKYM